MEGVVTSLDMGVGSLGLGGPIVATSKAFNCKLRFTSFIPLRRVKNVVMGNAALRPHRKGSCPHVTRAPRKVLGYINLRGGNIRCFYRRVCPRVGSVSAGVVMGIDKRSPRDCTRYTTHIGRLSGVPTVRLGVSYPGMGSNNVTFNIAYRNTTDIMGTIHGICSGALVIGLSPGMADVTSVTHTMRTRNTSSISLVGALVNVTISVRGHRPLLDVHANNLDNPYIGPITLHVICSITRTIGVPMMKLNNVRGTGSTVRFVVYNTATVRVKATGFVSPTMAGGIGSNVGR